MKAGIVTLPAKMMACGLESCARVCVIWVRRLLRMAKNVSTKSRQAERSQSGLIIRAVEIRHRSIDVIVLGFSHRMFVRWRAPLLSTTPKAPLSYTRGEVGRQLGLCPILALASWVSGRGGTAGAPAQPGPAGISGLAQQRPRSRAFL